MKRKRRPPASRPAPETPPARGIASPDPAASLSRAFQTAEERAAYGPSASPAAAAEAWKRFGF